MTNEEIEYAIERIEHLERIFDEVQNSFKNDPDFLENRNCCIGCFCFDWHSGIWYNDAGHPK